MTVWIAMLLGLVQGLCEFLPVSSSGHLVLLQTIFGINEGALFFDTMLHIGTLLGVFVVYYQEIRAMIKKPFQKKVGLLLVSTVFTAVLAFVFDDFIDAAYEGPLLGVGFLITTAVLLLSERVKRKKGRIESMSYGHALIVGGMQGIAILPGISRSGSTIAGSLFVGLSKKEASEYAFLLSIPAILGSLVLQIPDVLQETISVPWGPVIAGTVVAAISGYVAIKVMLKVLQKKSLKIFAYYTLALGILVLLDQFVFHVFFTNPLL